MPATKTLTDNRNNTLVRVNHTDHRITEPQGEIFYVCSSHADADDIAGAGLRPDYPFATIEYAVNQCTAGNQDVIYVLPGHTETVSEAGGLDFDKAGMTVIGVGTGDQRPLINFTTSTAADADVDADDITLVNLLFQCSIDGQLIMLDVNKADARILNCEFKEGTSAQPVDVVDITGSGANQCDRVKIQGCRFYFPTAGPATAIKVGAVHAGLELCDNWIQGDFSTAAVSSGSAFTDALIARNVISNVNTGDWAIELTAAATGMLVDNRLYADAAATCLDPGSMKCVGNLMVNAIDSTSVEVPAPNTSADTVEAALWGANGVTTYPAAAAAANGVSLAEVLRYNQDLGAFLAHNRNCTNYFAVTADFTSATWNTAASHEIATVTGAVRMRIVPRVTGTPTSAGGTATLVLGDETTTNSLIASTDAENLATGELWFDATDTRTVAAHSIWEKLDFVVTGGKDIGYTIGTEALTGGSIVFECWWMPISSDGAVVAGAGGAL